MNPIQTNAIHALLDLIEHDLNENYYVNMERVNLSKRIIETIIDEKQNKQIENDSN